VSAAHQEAYERWFQVGKFERRGEQVAFEMVDPEYRDVQRVRHGLAIHDADQQGADQSGAGRDCYACQAIGRDAGVGHRLVHDSGNGLQVFSARQFGHHSAENPMYVLRENHQAREWVGCARSQHRGGGFVAAGFDAEDAGHCG